MYACLLLQQGAVDALEALAAAFSPHLERCDERTALIPAYGLERLIGTPTDVAGALLARAGELAIDISLAIAGHPDTALLAARHIEGVTIVDPGREVEILGPLPIEVLPTSLDVLDTLRRWGVETLTDFAALPPLGVIERLGEEGGRLQALVEGRGTRPLRIARPPEDYTARTDLDEPLANSEPLLFVISGMVHAILRRLASHGLAAGRFAALFTPAHELRIAFPAPVQDPLVILKQVQLALDANRPRRAVASVTVELEPTPPRPSQHGLFTPPAAEPAQLQTLLARLRAIAGEDSVGAPERLNTHRPGAFRLRQDVLFQPGRPAGPQNAGDSLRLSFRCFRPPLGARVALNAQRRPARVEARGVRGGVLSAAGPWRSAGEWWAPTEWARDEWDVGLDDGALYRLYREHRSDEWFVEGVYD
jgi:protein ImuB